MDKNQFQRLKTKNDGEKSYRTLILDSDYQHRNEKKKRGLLKSIKSSVR